MEESRSDTWKKNHQIVHEVGKPSSNDARKEATKRAQEIELTARFKISAKMRIIEGLASAALNRSEMCCVGIPVHKKKRVWRLVLRRARPRGSRCLGNVSWVLGVVSPETAGATIEANMLREWQVRAPGNDLNPHARAGRVGPGMAAAD